MIGILWFLAGVFTTGAVVIARHLLKEWVSDNSLFDTEDFPGWGTPISERRLRPRTLRSAVDTMPDGKPYRVTIVPADYWPAVLTRKPVRQMPEGWEDETTPIFDQMYREWVNAKKPIPRVALELGKRSAETRRPGGRSGPRALTRSQRRRAARMARQEKERQTARSGPAPKHNHEFTEDCLLSCPAHGYYPVGPAPGRTPTGDRHDL